MGFDVYATDGFEEFCLERNVTYNFSCELYMNYWYVRNDLHEKTVEEALKRIEKAVARLINEGITPFLGRVDNLNSFLWVLTELYKEMIYFKRDMIMIIK